MAVSGELTALTAEQLEGALNSAMAQTDHLVLDFRDLEYMASAGFRVLLKAKKLLDAKGGELSVCNVSGAVKDVFGITGFCDILHIEY